MESFTLTRGRFWNIAIPSINSFVTAQCTPVLHLCSHSIAHHEHDAAYSSWPHLLFSPPSTFHLNGLPVPTPTMSVTFNTSSPAQSGEYNGFRYEIFDSNSTTATIRIHIPAEETVKAIPGCMLATSPNIIIKGKMKRTLKAMVGPDSVRSQTFTAKDSPGWVILAPGFYGSMTAVPIQDNEICVGDNAFLASIGEVESTSVSQSAKKAMFSGHGMFVKKVKGTGVVFVCAVGSLMSMELADGENVIVDNGHLVTWPRDITYDVEKASKKWGSSGLSGEGWVTRISGPGTINVQSRNAEALAEWVYETKRPC